jgi:hypothetical protein
LESTKPSREELFTLVWERPVTDIPKELEISDVGLGELCRRLQKYPGAVASIGIGIQKLFIYSE